MAQVKQEDEDETSSHVASLSHSQHGPLPPMHGDGGGGLNNTGGYACGSNVPFDWMKKEQYGSHPQPGMCKIHFVFCFIWFHFCAILCVLIVLLYFS